MDEKRQNLKMHLKLFVSFKNMIGVLLASTFIYIFIFCSYLFKIQDAYIALDVATRFNFYYCLVTMICLFIIMNGSSYNHSDEVISGIDKGNDSYQKNILIISLILNLILQVIFLVLFVGFSFYKNNIYFLTHFLKPYLFNLYIPQLICIGLVYITSRLKNKTFSVIITLLFILFTSPLAESIYWRTQPSFPIDKVYQYLRLPFTFFFQSGDWGSDIQYGLQCDSQRFYTFVFWFILFIGFNILLNYKNRFKSEKIKSYKWLVLSAFTAITLVLMYMPEGKYRMNYNWDGVDKDLYMYIYDEMKKELPDKLDYYFDNYDLNIDIHRQLNVDGSMELMSKEKKSEFVFTLYQDYKIKELNADGLKDYKQDGHYVYLSFDKPIDKVQIQIDYSGYHPKFYSTHEGVMLPGFFAWYPMAGEQQIFYNYSYIDYTNYGYMISNRIHEANVTLHTDQSYITNLDEVDKNTYQGKTDSVSLFDGYIEKSNDSLVISYLPMIDEYYDIDMKVNAEKENIHNAIQNVKDKYLLDLSDLLDKKFIFVSKDFSRNFQNDNIVIFDDYVVCSYISDDFLYNAYFNNAKSTTLLELIKTVPGENIEEKLTGLSDFYSGDDENVIKIITLLQSVHEKLGTEKLMEYIYEYAYDMDRYDDIEFLERIVREYETR